MTGATFLDFAVRSLLIGALSWGLLAGFRLSSWLRNAVLLATAGALLWTLAGVWLPLPGISWLPSASAANPPGAASTLLNLVGTIWLTGLGLVVLGETLAHLNLHQILGKAVPCQTPAWEETLRTAQARLHWPHAVELRFSETLGPCAIGLHRRLILLPHGSEHWPEATRLTVLLHELAHFQRGDLAWQWFVRGLLATQWFNPFAPLLRRLWETDRETACDALAARLAGLEPATYAETLLNLATDSPNVPAVPALAMLPRRQSQLEYRIRALLDPAAPRQGASRIAEIAATATALIFLAACALSHSPQPPRPEVWTPTEIELRLTASPFPDA